MDQTLMDDAKNKDTTTELASMSDGDDVPWQNRAGQNNNLSSVRKPSLDCRKDKDGQFAIHIEKAPVESNPDERGLLRQHRFTPLHIATITGNIQLMKTLLCPQSLAEVTNFDETALHLAAKYDQIGAFQVLLEETLKLKQEDILHNKDYEGNDILHIAIARKQIQIIQWLLVDNPKHGPLVPVNSRNERGYTAADLHFSNFNKGSDKAISILLRQAGGRRGQSSHSHSVSNSMIMGNDMNNTLHQHVDGARSGQSSPSHSVQNTMMVNEMDITSVPHHEAGARSGGQSSSSQSVRSEQSSPSESFRNAQSSSSQSALNSITTGQNAHVLLICSSLIAGGTYSGIFNLNDALLVIKPLRVRDTILHPALLPAVFYTAMFMTVTFTVSMIGVAVSLLSMIKERSFLLQALPLLGLAAFFFSYAFAIAAKVPKFSVTIQAFVISSFWLVWLCTGFSILVLYMLWLVAIRIFKPT